MPVFNRLALTKGMIDCLRAQKVDETFRLIIVDDGSTDGTAQYLSGQQDITVLEGDGNLWWGGAIDLGFRYLMPRAKPDDWILLVNNDTRLLPDYLQSLLDTARSRSPAAVGSIVRDEDAPFRLLSIGPRINPWWCLIRDKADPDTDYAADNSLPDVVEVDALAGRGVLYPVSAINAAGGMRPNWLPHYMADYELSLRVKRAGCSLLVDTKSAVFSNEDYGNTYRAPSLKEKLFSVRSPSYLPALIAFWWLASRWPQRLTMPFRLALFLIFPGLRRTHK